MYIHSTGCAPWTPVKRPEKSQMEDSTSWNLQYQEAMLHLERSLLTVSFPGYAPPRIVVILIWENEENQSRYQIFCYPFPGEAYFRKRGGKKSRYDLSVGVEKKGGTEGHLGMLCNSYCSGCTSPTWGGNNQGNWRWPIKGGNMKQPCGLQASLLSKGCMGSIHYACSVKYWRVLPDQRWWNYRLQ